MLITSSIIAAAAVAAGGPTYLRCTFPPNDKPIMLTADEANSAVTISIPSTGLIRQLPASFTAGDVRFTSGPLTYIVNRNDLSAQRYWDKPENAEAGVCKVEEAPKRAF